MDATLLLNLTNVNKNGPAAVTEIKIKRLRPTG